MWVKNLEAGKPKAKVEEGCFVGIDDESKGCHIYWAGKQQILVEQDIYFDPRAVEDARIEGEWELDANDDEEDFDDDDVQPDSTPKPIAPTPPEQHPLMPVPPQEQRR